jgi:CARDB
MFHTIHRSRKNAAVLIATVLFLAMAAAQASALVQTQLLYDMDDTYINSSSADTNYDGQALVSGKDGGTTVEAWFRLNMSKPSGYYVLSSALWTYVDAITTSRTFFIHPASGTSWTETDLTWNNNPGYGASLYSQQVDAQGWWTWDVAGDFIGSFNSGNSFAGYVIRLETSSIMYMEDKENTHATGNVPYLNLTMMIPEVYLLSPPDATITYTTSFTFQYNTTDAGNIVNCSLLFDGAVNKTNTSVIENTTSLFTLSNVFPGSHTWAIRCYDVNRYSYEINPGTRTLDVLAHVEWTNPSSATRLDLGSAPINSATLTGTRQVYANNSQTNVRVTCTSGDCSRITTNWTTRPMASAENVTVLFSCPTTVAGSLEAEFALTSDQDATADTLTVNCTILAPDLRISSANITFSDSAPTEGETVTITAGIYNDGTSAANNAVVRFYEGHYSTGAQIGGDHTISLNAGESTAVQQNWTSKVGSYDIYAVVDPPVDTNGSIAEGNESNNYAYNTISTSMWTIFVGNVTGYLALETSDNKTLLKWDVADTTNSNIYVTDTDSSPSFNSLLAFSRNTSGSYMGDDFTELDSALNTTAYPDSINSTYTNGGSPVATRIFTIFGRALNDVPIVNSTGISTFVTGILWDSSDDSNNNRQYDNTSKEDVVFVTVVNQSMAGTYGTYDYEIRVPARLDNYQGPDYQTVTLYSEIK